MHDRLEMRFVRVMPDWGKLQPCLGEPEAVAAEPMASTDVINIDTDKPDEAAWTGDANDIDDYDRTRGSYSGNAGASSRNGLEPKCISLCVSFFRWKQSSWHQDKKAWQKFEQNVMTLYYSRPNITRQVDNLTWR